MCPSLSEQNGDWIIMQFDTMIRSLRMRCGSTQTLHSITGRTICCSSLVRKACSLIIAFVVGAAFSLLFKWQDAPVYEVLAAHSIFVHNLLLALIVTALGHYVAAPFFLCNMGYLAFAIVGSLKSAGLVATLSVTIVHIPLEVAAWLVFWIASEHVSKCYVAVWQAKRKRFAVTGNIIPAASGAKTSDGTFVNAACTGASVGGDNNTVDVDTDNNSNDNAVKSFDIKTIDIKLSATITTANITNVCRFCAIGIALLGFAAVAEWYEISRFVQTIIPK